MVTAIVIIVLLGLFDALLFIACCELERHEEDRDE